MTTEQLTLFDLEKPPTRGYAAPLIVCPGGWGDTLPDWMMKEVMIQRGRKVANDDGLATDVEATAYMYTASLVAPLTSDWAEIYIYLVTRLMPEMPADIRRDTITTYQEGLLNDLKRRIRDRQNKFMKEERKKNARSNEVTKKPRCREVDFNR